MLLNEEGNGTNDDNNNNGDEDDDNDDIGDDDTDNNGTVSGQSSRRSGYYVNSSDTSINLMEEISVEDNSRNPQLPEGQVAGEQVSVVPTGAPDTGMGGTSKTRNNPFLSIVFLALTLSLIKLYPKVNVLG
jgi:hypothetical protein